jgi:hypothetical protein
VRAVRRSHGRQAATTRCSIINGQGGGGKARRGSTFNAVDGMHGRDGENDLGTAMSWCRVGSAVRDACVHVHVHVHVHAHVHVHLMSRGADIDHS